MGEIIANLMNYAMDHGISVRTTNELPASTPSLTNTRERYIMINNNCGQQLALQMAHEIGHLMLGHTSIQPLPFTTLTNWGDELEANQWAIKKLIPYYANGKEDEQLNTKEFMELFVIPGHLDNIVRTEMIMYVMNN
ncbi:ImmA/IrrE family metallo-endopeptidase [Lentilactobacillus senioris]|uniref:ImmA/IrrE family metallo-endopeptidase n=1 Tax=Lentilactobacillus senioris TaxID=931534 RepID=UPI002281339A|nr:ImmA/IrrE family metallo-endopeptidase [Lentilactobacillus senioris]MCY9807490.1 ImmA/IrrE family metallo-endopeptidase [Lentilactobacillus senioris]